MGWQKTGAFYLHKLGVNAVGAATVQEFDTDAQRNTTGAT